MAIDLQHPPAGWPQKVRHGLPFPPGQDDEGFESYLDRLPGEGEWDRFEINCSTLEIYRQRGGRWDAPGWMELPARVRERLHTLARNLTVDE